MITHRILFRFLLITGLISVVSCAFAQPTPNLFRVGRLRTGFFVESVAVSGNYAYVITESGFSIVNISNPTSPSETGFFDLHSIRDLVVAGNYVYLTTYDSLIRIVDVSNHTSPIQISSYSTGPLASVLNCIAVSGNYLYFGTNDSIKIVNVTNPTTPLRVGSIRAAASYMAVSGNNLFVLSNYSTDASRVFNISNPAAPTLIAQTWSFNTCDYFVVSGTRAFVETPSGVYIYDISNVNNIHQVGYVSGVSYSNIAVSGNFLYIPWDRGLRIWNIAQPSTPFLATIAGLDAVSSCVTVNGNYAYVGGANGLYVVNINVPDSATFVGKSTLPGEAIRVHRYGDNYCVVCRYGIAIVNASNPASPTLAGRYDLPEYNYSFGGMVKDSLLYVESTYENLALDSCNINILNIAHPDSIYLVSSYVIGHRLYNLLINGNYMYVTTYDSGLFVFDIQNPTAIYRVVTYSSTRAYHFCIQGNYCYQLDVNGFYVSSIDSLGLLTPVGNYRMQSDFQEICVSGHYAYIATQSGGLTILDISNPQSPTYVSFFAVTFEDEYLLGMTLVGDRAFFSLEGSGIRVVDVSNPATPTIVGYCVPPGDGAVQSLVDGSYAYVAETDYFSVYDCSAVVSVSEPTSHTPPTHFSLANPYPNPFNACTLIRFELPQQSLVHVQVFDALGRQVTTLSNGTMSAGSHQLQWNGAKVSSGQYYVRMSAPKFSETKKVVLVK